MARISLSLNAEGTGETFAGIVRFCYAFFLLSRRFTVSAAKAVLSELPSLCWKHFFFMEDIMEGKKKVSFLRGAFFSLLCVKLHKRCSICFACYIWQLGVLLSTE